MGPQVLHQHPAVQDAQVVGVPDERLGEEVCACVRLKDVVREFDKEELIEFCKVLQSRLLLYGDDLTGQSGIKDICGELVGRFIELAAPLS